MTSYERLKCSYRGPLVACGLKQALKVDYLNFRLRVTSNTHSDCFFWDNRITFGLKRLPCFGYKSLQSLHHPPLAFCSLRVHICHGVIRLRLTFRGPSVGPACWLAAAQWAGLSLKVWSKRGSYGPSSRSAHGCLVHRDFADTKRQ